MNMFAVVIPYYQREPGVLRRTLASVATQDTRDSVSVYVVDDESPASPEPEIRATDWPAHIQCKLIKQANRGPGAARNRAFDSLEGEAFVALLDSDDTWEPHHLSSARYAFDLGFDYYSADTSTAVKGEQYHELFFPDGLPLSRVGSEIWGHRLDEPLIHFSVWRPIANSSSLVITRKLLGDARYRDELRYAGEDGLFNTTLAAKTPKVFISQRIDVHLGRGVNILSEGDWGSSRAFMRSHHFLISRLLMRPLVRNADPARAALRSVIRRASEDFWMSAIAAARRKQLPAGLLFRTVAAHPSTLRRLPKALYRTVRRSSF